MSSHEYIVQVITKHKSSIL